MKYLFIAISITALTACTNHLYQGKTTYQDNGKTCEALVYWNNTTHIFNSEGKSSSVVIRNASNPGSFTLSDTREENLILMLPSGEYEDVIYNSHNDTELVCGVFSGKGAHQKGEVSRTEFKLFCNKIPNPLKPNTNGIKAKYKPFIFVMLAPKSEFSWAGEELKAEISLSCK
ncbi:hypothetical protein [Candidatus Colwellia aromaticivorans]|uniref:hypothetical protein n=1 Tax=Candidatus Colwellia aromaticivorans TaxID=2267621 RepID=UPI000DF4ACB2|nr:hypothetical protein [Candidatus Colwellia aromaticivorans]